MFHMLTCFDLKPEHSLEEFQQSLIDYTAHMHELDLVESNSPVGARQADIILDTDDERNQNYFMLMYFRDKAQSDNAVTYIKSREEPIHSIHTKLYSQGENYIFTCWQDVE